MNKLELAKVGAQFQYNRMFSRYFAPRDFENERYTFEELPRGMVAAKQRICELIEAGYGKSIRVGYAATSIRGVHDYYVRYAENTPTNGAT